MKDLDYEKLGAFYLGSVDAADGGAAAGGGAARESAAGDGTTGPTQPLLYDSKDLTTHGLCVGMTGSGKTGLCLSLLEEAAIDGVPAIAIDPKGDLGNLMLAFPELRPADFEPWIEEAEATRAGRSVAEHAAVVAKRWREGLAASGQSGERVRRFRDAVDVTIYTPGSSAGMPISVLASLQPPASALIDDADALRDRVSGTVSSLLALLQIDANPLHSREHILLSTIVQHAWAQGRALDLAGLIAAIIEPPVQRIGVMDIDSFFPAKARQTLAMSLNNLLAAPGFSAWLEGEPLDIQRLLWTEAGKPRLAILSIAHLSDDERMFFVTLLLNELIAWMRAQAGTSSLRALLYMDEVFGFFPPVANPPSKTPMLTLLKQARAFGIGVVLATQNPVDLDYKGLSNCGTWFLGRLQTERDLGRVMDGLEGVSGSQGRSFDRAAMEARLSGLKSRHFVMHNVHDDGPTVFRTRWAMSYLRGPLTRSQIRTLCAARKAELAGSKAQPAAPATAAAMAPLGASAAPSAHAAATPALVAAAAATTPADSPPAPPLVPPSIDQLFMLPRVEIAAATASTAVVYQPMLLASAVLHYAHRYADIDEWLEPTLIAALPKRGTTIAWEAASWHRFHELRVATEPLVGARFAELPASVSAKAFATIQRKLKSHLQKKEGLPVWQCKAPKLWSRYGEGEAEVRARAQLLLREQRDLQVEKLRAKHAPKLARLQEKIRKAEHKLKREQAQASQSKLGAAVSVGTSVLGAMFGRSVLRSSGTAIRGTGRAMQQGQDVAHAEEDLAVLKTQLLELEDDFQQDVDALETKEVEVVLAKKTLRPRKTDLSIERLAIVWMPYSGDPPQPLWR